MAAKKVKSSKGTYYMTDILDGFSGGEIEQIHMGVCEISKVKRFVYSYL